MNDVTIEVFFSQTCPKCPPQKDLVKRFESDDVKVRTTDVARNNKRAKNHGVRAVPTTVVDGPALEQKTGFKGVTSEEAIETAIDVAKGNKDPEALEGDSFLERLKNFF